MAKVDATPTPAAPGGIDMAALAVLIGTAVAEATKPLQERLEKLTAPAPAPTPQPDAPAGKDGALTAADIAKMLDDKFTQRDQSASVKAARDAAAARMNDLPVAYRAQLPNTADAGELARAEQTIRAEYAADFKKSGATVPDVNGNPPPNGSPATRVPVDTSKMSGAQLIAEGLKQRPVTPATPATADAAK